MKCRHCGKGIRLDTSGTLDIYYHPHSQKVYCTTNDLIDNDRLPPRAEPPEE